MLLLKCSNTSPYPNTFRPSVGTLRTVPRPLCSSVGTLRTVPRTLQSSVGTLRTLPRPPTQLLGHFALSQDLVLGHLVSSQDIPHKFWDTSHCPKTLRPSVGTLRTVQ